MVKQERTRIVLLSGGLDSAVLLAIWRNYTKVAVHVDYDHPARLGTRPLCYRRLACGKTVNVYPMEPRSTQ